MATLSYSQAVEQLASREAEYRALFAEFGPRVSGPSYGHLMSERDNARGWFLRDTITALRRHTRALERAGKTTGGERAGSSQDFDRDSIREPDSIEDRRVKDPWDLRDMRTYGRETGQVAAEYRSRAITAVEHMPGCSDAIRSAATDILENFDDKRSTLARHALVTSKPAYLRAWSKLMCNKEIAISPEERRALDEVQAYRALTTVDIQSGYLIPLQLDPTLVSTSPGLRSDLRKAANVVVATSETYRAPTAQNVAYAFQSEDVETSDASPPFGMATARNWTARAFLPITIEAMQDFQNLQEGLALLLAGGQADAEARAFVQGTGIEEPVGIVSSLAATASSVVNTATTGVFALADIYALQAALPAHWRLTSSFLANDLVYNKVREFASGGSSSAFWSNITQDAPPILFGRNALEAEAMSGVVASNNKILVFGDMKSYTICDRWGTIVETVPWLPGTHGRPSGTRGFLSTFRVGGDVTNPVGLKLLNVT